MAAVVGVVAHYAAHVRGAERGRQVVHNPCYAFVEVVAGDALEYLPQEGVGLRYKRGGLLAREGVGRCVVQARRKHPVGYGLRVDVGEAVGSDVVDEHRLEGVKLPL